MELKNSPLHHRTAAAILDAAAHLLAANPDASMADVAAAASVSRATLYRLLRSRRAVRRGSRRTRDRRRERSPSRRRTDRVPVEEAIQRMVRALLAASDHYGLLIREHVEADPNDAHRVVVEPIRAVTA